MTGRLRLFCRQWRRTVLGTCLVIAFCVIGILNDAFPIDEPELLQSFIGIIAIFLTGLIVATAVTFALAIFVPGLLCLTELWGFTILILFLIIPLWSDFLAMTGLPEWLGCVLLFVTFLVVHWALYGDWQSCFRKQKPLISKRRISLKADPAIVFNALRPDPTRPNDHYWRGTNYLPAPEGSDVDFMMINPRRHGLKDVTVFVCIEDYPEAVGFTQHTSSANVNDNETPDVKLDVKIEPNLKGGAQLEITETITRYSWGQRLNWFLSNDLADHMYCMRAAIEGRSDGSIHGLQMNRNCYIGSISPPARAA